MPTIRPMIAPRHRLGMNSPQGTLMPKVKIVRVSFMIRARIKSQIALKTPGPAAAISMAEFTSVKFLL